MNQILVSVERMKRDIREAAATMSRDEARYLVDTYYQMQEDRMRADARIRAMADSGEPHAIITHLSTQTSTLEGQIKSALDRYTVSHAVGQWMRAIKGVGPVIAAGYMANFDITRRNEQGDGARRQVQRIVRLH